MFIWLRQCDMGNLCNQTENKYKRAELDML